MLRTACVLALVTAIGGDPPSPFHDLSFERAQALAEKDGKLVLVDFFTTWCGPCKKLDATTWKDAQVQAWLANHCVALKIDAEKNAELAARFHVGTYPTIVLVKPSGAVMDTLVGYRDAPTFLADAASALEGKSALVRARDAAGADEKNPSLRMRFGDELARSGRHEAALSEYLWCFDHGRASPAFTGVRLSFLLGAIRALARQHPPALRALEERRDAAEARIAAGSTSHDDVADASALNRVLETPARTLALYDRLRAAGPVSANVKIALTDEILAPLVAARRYADALELFDKPEGFVTGSIRMHASTRAIRVRIDAGEDPGMEALMKSLVVERCAPVYEALVGTKRADEAAKISDRLMTFDATAATCVALIGLAARAGSDDAARTVGAKGLALLADPADKKLVEQALGRVGNAK